jgi:hypothetical protein
MLQGAFFIGEKVTQDNLHDMYNYPNYILAYAPSDGHVDFQAKYIWLNPRIQLKTFFSIREGAMQR